MHISELKHMKMVHTTLDEITNPYIYSYNAVAGAFYAAVAEYVVPAIVVLDMIAIPLTIIGMTKATISKKLRLYYVLIALFSIPFLVFGEILFWFVSFDLQRYSRGSVYFVFDDVAPIACQMDLYLTYIADFAAAFVYVLLSFERLIVTALPFRARQFTLRRSIICCTVLVAFAVCFNLLCSDQPNRKNVPFG
jgi:hypothetical protein